MGPGTLAGASVAALILVLVAATRSLVRPRRVPSFARGRAPSAHRSPRPLAPVAPPGWFVGWLAARAPAVDPTRSWWAVLAVAATTLVGAAGIGGPGLVIIVLAVLGGAGLAMADLGGRRADRQVDAELPSVLDQVANGVRAGASLPGAIVAAGAGSRGPVRRDLRSFEASLAFGIDAQTALARWATARPTPGVRLSVAALALSFELGGSSRPIDGVAATLRDHLAIDREVRALSAQARSSAAVIIVAPWVFLLLVGSGDTSLWSFFVRTAIGFGCLAGGLLLDAVGAWWMWCLVRGPR